MNPQYAPPTPPKARVTTVQAWAIIAALVALGSNIAYAIIW